MRPRGLPDKIVRNSVEAPSVPHPMRFEEDAIVLGGGLTGLSAAYAFSSKGVSPQVFEADDTVGGLSKTIIRDGYRFDIGGHRFHAKDKKIEAFVRGLMGEELLNVSRKSRIYMNGRFFDYPLKPLNSLSGLGPLTVLRVIADYCLERAKGLFKADPGDSLEDWVVRNFGRKMFEIYFRIYSEKVWGIPCNRISRSWVERRIEGLSLATVIKNAFSKAVGRDVPTLIDDFLYPALGIGRISDRLAEEIGHLGSVHTSSPVKAIHHDGKSITSVVAGEKKASADAYVSTIPLTAFVNMMDPAPPDEVLEASSGLGYRDLVIVAIAVDRPVVTNLSWIYVPDKDFSFGRIHEPKVWSSAMAPEGKTLLVVEYFCFQNEGVWNNTDEKLIETSVEGLGRLGFVKPDEVSKGWVLRVPGAYPLFEIGYEEMSRVILEYLSGFDNLKVAGRAGRFAYLNMDHAIAAGREAALESFAILARAYAKKQAQPYRTDP